MWKFEVTATVPVIGRIKHVIKAPDEDAAAAKMKRAHGQAVNVTVRKVEAD